MARSIYIYCDGGFGNRLNNLVTGLLIADLLNYQPIIVWPVNIWCGAEFSDIFSNTNYHVENIELKEMVGDKEKFHYWIVEDHLKIGMEYESPLQQKDFISAVSYLQKSNKPIFLYTALIPQYLPFEYLVPFFNKLKYQPNILDSAYKFLSQFLGLSLIGLHMRCSDIGLKDEQISDLYRFAEKRKDLQFFVCSDNKEVEEKFISLPNAHSYPKTAYVEKLVEGSWNEIVLDNSGRAYPFNVNRSKQSVVDAIVDLLILSHTSIIKTSNSTFLNAAIFIQNARNQVK
ncbi:MAG: hypothetical protein M1579_06510 [Gammaproteobacteria bacterium]|nr:hypothetical protein [Gammaproteobacteria bacterium]